jgi:hypothetical protein
MSKATKQTDKTVVRKVTKALACKLTDIELLAYGRDVAQAYADLSGTKSELDKIKKEYAGKVTEHEGKIAVLSARLGSGMETRDVACEEVKNWTKATYTVTRLDTLDVIEARPMREDEKAMELNLQIEADAAKVAADEQVARE